MRTVHVSACVCVILMLDAFAWAQKAEMVAQTGHSFLVSSVAFSPDGKTLASSSADQTIKLWDVASGTELRSLRGHTEGVWSVAFSPDGKKLASGGMDKTIRLWDVVSGTELRTLKGHSDDVWSVAFSRDGKMLASGSVDKTIKLWDLAELTEPRTLTGHSDAVWSVAFNADAQVLASGSMDNTVKLWDVTKGIELRTLKGHSDAIYSVAFGAGGKTLASGSPDNTIRIWDVASGKELQVLRGTVGVYSVAFSPDGGTLVSGDAQNVRLWEVASGTELRAFKGHSELVQSVAFSPDGKTLASGSWDHTIKLWDRASGAELRALEEHSGWALSTAFSPNGKMLASGGWDKTVKLWDLAGGTELQALTGHTEAVRSVAFSPDGQMLASASGDKTVRLWNIAGETELRSLYCNSEVDVSLAFSPDGKTLASGGRDNKIKLWDLGTGKELRTLSGHSDWIYSVAISSDGKRLASSSRDQTLKLWDFVSGMELRTLRGHTDWVSSIAFSPDGLTLASGSNDHAVKLWEVATGKELRTLKGHSDWIYSVAFSPDGKTLASGGRDNTIKLWDVINGTELRTLKANSGWVYSVTFSHDGRTLVSSSLDTYLRFWSTVDGAELAGLVALDRDDWFVTTGDGLFDGSPAAWNKIMWRFESNTFNHVPVEVFFGYFYYPGLLTDIFAGKRPKAPADISDKDRRQPQVRLTVAETKVARNAAVKINISQAPAGAQDLRLFLNGSLIRVWHGDLLQGRSSVTLETTIPIVAGENQLTAYAFNRANIKSSDSSLIVVGADSLKRAGTLYVLAIGINTYLSKGYDLKFALADVDEIGKQVKAYQDKLSHYAHTEVISLTDQHATKPNIMQALRRFADSSPVALHSSTAPALIQQFEKIKSIEPEDGLVIYYAGHGAAIGERFYLLPHDFVGGSKEQVEASSISDIELNEVLEHIYANKLLMIIDACQSGQALGAEKEGRGPMNSKGLAQLAYDKGMYLLAAAQGFQAAKEVSRSQSGQTIEHGLLTFALLEGLTKARQDSLGRITEREWMKYAVGRVPRMQIEEMKKRNLEIKQRSESRQRGELVFLDGDNDGIDPERRNVQRPRVFYRRELERHPLIVARQ